MVRPSATLGLLFAALPGMQGNQNKERLEQGDVLMGVEKSQGLKKGEKVVRLRPIAIVSCRKEAIGAITQDDVFKEGFEMSPGEFVFMFCEHNKCTPQTQINRIEFAYIDAPGSKTKTNQ